MPMLGTQTSRFKAEVKAKKIVCKPPVLSRSDAQTIINSQLYNITLEKYLCMCDLGNHFMPLNSACWHRMDGSASKNVNTYGGSTEISMLNTLLDLYIAANGDLAKITNKAYAKQIIYKILNLIYDLQVRRRNYMESIMRDNNSFYMASLAKIKSASSIMQQQEVNISTMLKS